jgi:hypothetical protein
MGISRFDDNDLDRREREVEQEQRREDYEDLMRHEERDERQMYLGKAYNSASLLTVPSPVDSAKEVPATPQATGLVMPFVEALLATERDYPYDQIVQRGPTPAQLQAAWKALGNFMEISCDDRDEEDKKAWDAFDMLKEEYA